MFKKKKGQAVLEMSFAIGLFLLFFLFVLFYGQERKYDVEEINTVIEQRDSCLGLSNNIAGVFSLGEGAVVNISVERNASIYGDELQIDVDDVTCSFIGSVTDGSVNNFTVNKGYVLIKNINNTIFIEDG